MDHRPLTPGVSKMVGLEPIWELLSLGAIDSAPLFLGLYLAKLPFSRVNKIETSIAFLLGTYNSFGSDLGLSLTRVNCKFNYGGILGELKFLESRLLTILSDLDWWIAEISSLAFF